MEALNQAEKRAEKCIQLEDDLESKDLTIKKLKEQLKTTGKAQAVS